MVITSILGSTQRPIGSAEDEERANPSPFREDQGIQHSSLALPASLPETMSLATLRDGRLKVVSPIEVKFVQEGKQIAAEAAELSEFGFGENYSEAITDLQHAIVELYFSLKGEQDRLGPDLQRVWAILQDKLIERVFA